MATNDVPGANPANMDELGPGCWAEHADGTAYVRVDDVHQRLGVVFFIYDMAKEPIVAYRTSMPRAAFEKKFSWNGKGDKWTWHDKTEFPWERLIKGGLKDGEEPVHAADVLTTAERVAKSLDARVEQDFDAASAAPRPGVPGSFFEKLGRALDKFMRE